MAITVQAATSVTATSTENFVQSFGGAASYVLHFNTLNMTTGDITEVRFYKQIASTTTAYVAYPARFEGKQAVDDYIKVLGPITNASTSANAVRVSVKQPYGTGRAYRYEIIKIA